jgi:AraC family transcriptional regulator
MKSPKREMVFDRTIGKLRPIGRPPVVSSGHLHWRGYHLEQQSLPSLEARDVIWLNNMVFLQLNPITLERKSGSRFISHRILPGNITIVPAQGSTYDRSRDHIDVLAISIDPAFMTAVCGELTASDRFELKTTRAVEDHYIKAVCLALHTEVKNGGKSGRLYSDSLITALAVHLASKYSARRTTRAGAAEGSPPMIRQAQEFILENLTRNLTLTEIADSVNVSAFHFSRVFKQHTGLSPYQFVLKQRIERARQLLLRGEHSLSDVALQLGFADQSHFSLHFKRFSGMTPKQFSSQFARRRR